MAKFACTNQSCQFRLKFGTYTNLNMQNSMLVLAAAVLKNQKQPLVDVLRNRCSEKFRNIQPVNIAKFL